MLALICSIRAELKGAYGFPRMVRGLRARAFLAGKEMVEADARQPDSCAARAVL